MIEDVFNVIMRITLSFWLAIGGTFC